MAAPNSKSETSLQIKRTLAAPREKVFRAFTEPEALKQWWMPGEGFSVPSAEVDLRVGGAYRIGMKNPKGKVFYVVGTYREIRAPERLVYTWRWEGIEEGMGDTLVSIELRDLSGSTELIVTHEQFPDPEVRDNHRQGWNGCLDRMEKILADL
jgi:uncharacterized protein YndB with AHSA1/START domain